MRVAYARLTMIACLLGFSACIQPQQEAAVVTPVDRELNSGVFIHERTGMHFPEQVAGFTRGNVTRFSGDESNIGVAYNRLGAKFNFAITVYLYPARGSFQGEIDALSALLESQYADDGFEWAQRDRASVTQGDQELDTWSGVGLFQKQMPLGEAEPWVTVTYLMQIPQGFLKYRVSLPQSYGQDGIQRMMEFLRELAWPASFTARS